MTQRAGQNQIAALDELQVMLASDGDRQAFQLLYRRWYPRLLRHALRLMGHEDDAIDVLQDASLVIAKNIHRLRSPEKFGPWAYTIVRNRAATYIKKQQKHRSLKDAMRENLLLSLHPAPADSRVEHLRELMCHLSTVDQEVLHAYYGAGMSVHQISLCLNLQEGTIKSRLYTARNHLKSAYKDIQGDKDE